MTHTGESGGDGAGCLGGLLFGAGAIIMTPFLLASFLNEDSPDNSHSTTSVQSVESAMDAAGYAGVAGVEENKKIHVSAPLGGLCEIDVETNAAESSTYRIRIQTIAKAGSAVVSEWNASPSKLPPYKHLLDRSDVQKHCISG